MSPRETIYKAMFDLLMGTSTIFRTKSRRLQHWSDVAPTDQPAIFLTQGQQVASLTQKMPTVWTLDASIFLYAHTGGDLQTPPMSILNPIVDIVVANLLPTINGEQTLGGLVERCRIDGAIETDEGILGDQAVVIIPVKMFLPQ